MGHWGTVIYYLSSPEPLVLLKNTVIQYFPLNQLSAVSLASERAALFPYVIWCCWWARIKHHHLSNRLNTDTTGTIALEVHVSIVVVSTVYTTGLLFTPWSSFPSDKQLLLVLIYVTVFLPKAFCINEFAGKVFCRELNGTWWESSNRQPDLSILTGLYSVL